jgi:outer membrane protein assembly factor BamB
MKLHVFFLLFLTWGLSAQCAELGVVSPDQWPRFRGPGGTGKVTAETLPASWTTEDWTWQADLPGVGHSSPVVWNEKIYLTSADEESRIRHLFCHDLHTGKLVWSRDFPGAIERHHKQNSSASSTVTADSHGIYWLWGTSQNVRLEALTHDGESRWSVDLGSYIGQHGFGGSPVVWENVVIVPLEQNTEGTIVGIDASTGKVRWKLPRDGCRKGGLFHTTRSGRYRERTMRYLHK